MPTWPARTKLSTEAGPSIRGFGNDPRRQAAAPRPGRRGCVRHTESRRRGGAGRAPHEQSFLADDSPRHLETLVVVNHRRLIDDGEIEQMGNHAAPDAIDGIRGVGAGTTLVDPARQPAPGSQVWWFRSARAMRSLTLPPGFNCSHLPSTGDATPAETCSNATSGVWPISSRMVRAFVMVPATSRPSVA